MNVMMGRTRILRREQKALGRGRNKGKKKEEGKKRKSRELGELDGSGWEKNFMEYLKLGGGKNWLKNYGKGRFTHLSLPTRSVKVGLRIQSVIIALSPKRVNAAMPVRITNKS